MEERTTAVKLPAFLSLQQALILMVICVILALIADIALVVLWVRAVVARGDWMTTDGIPYREALIAAGIVPYLIAIAGFWAVDPNKEKGP